MGRRTRLGALNQEIVVARLDASSHQGGIKNRVRFSTLSCVSGRIRAH